MDFPFLIILSRWLTVSLLVGRLYIVKRAVPCGVVRYRMVWCGIVVSFGISCLKERKKGPDFRSATATYRYYGMSQEKHEYNYYVVL